MNTRSTSAWAAAAAEHAVTQQMQAARGNGMTGQGTLTYRGVTSQVVPGKDSATVEVDACANASQFVVKERA